MKRLGFMLIVVAVFFLMNTAMAAPGNPNCPAKNQPQIQRTQQVNLSLKVNKILDFFQFQFLKLRLGFLITPTGDNGGNKIQAKEKPLEQVKKTGVPPELLDPGK